MKPISVECWINHYIFYKEYLFFNFLTKAMYWEAASSRERPLLIDQAISWAVSEFILSTVIFFFNVYYI